MTKQYIAIGKTDLFYNSMGLCGNFTTGCNKVVIEPRVVQFWSEIILVISNHAYDFSSNCTPLSSITIINLQYLYDTQISY